MTPPGNDTDDWGYVANSVFAMRPPGFPLNITTDGRTVPSAQIVTATVARLVSLVDVRT